LFHECSRRGGSATVSIGLSARGLKRPVGEADV
jgi:hypothetical protein